MSERKRLTTPWVEKKIFIFISWLKKEKWNITEKKRLKKKEQTIKRQVPRNSISILTGTAFAVQYSTHWAAGNLPWKKKF